MNYGTTAQALAAITDEGLFERIAAAVLREACPICRVLSHPGVNASGKTVKAPVDGICFVSGADPPHLVAVHHTTTASNGLRNKWLHDPALVTPRKGKKPTAPPGDLIKTAEIIAKERERTPDLLATLILTTNEEPDEELVRDVAAAGRKRGLAVDIWSRSCLCDVLDNRPTGQWIRASLLGIEQVLLSPELLHELSLKSLSLNQPHESPDAWVDRALDDTLRSGLHRDVTFLVAESGLGKSVACHRLVTAHVERGGFGLILSHDTIASAPSLEQAVMVELRRLHPLLSQLRPSALEFCSPEHPILLIVEDINQSGKEAPRLAEKLANWSHDSSGKDAEHALAASWRLICPVWPESLDTVREQDQKRISRLCVMANGFSKEEGTNAVLARGHLAGHPYSRLHAQEVASALGHDPLLIALHDPKEKPEPDLVIAGYIERSLARAAADDHDHTPADYGQALRILACEMLLRRQIELDWLEVKGWSNSGGEFSFLLARTARKGELLRLVGTSREQRLIFRHDRVRDWVLADGVTELHHTGRLCDDLVADPYFAEVLGAALAHSAAWEDMLEQVTLANPLALFHAFRLTSQAGDVRQRAFLQRIIAWLDSSESQSPAYAHLRWEALAVLARTDSTDVPPLIRKFPDRTHSGQLARFRNGDLSGGIELCLNVEPGTGAPWRDAQIEHAKLRDGRRIADALAEVLRRPNLKGVARVGALRLAGHLADHTLAEAIEACWVNDTGRLDILRDYLWATAECCKDDPARYLGPLCDAWASFSNEPEKDGWPAPRDEVAEYGLRWAFEKWPPAGAIEYFINRAAQEDLDWPITNLLHCVDHPKAVLFVAQRLAEIQDRDGGTNPFFLHFLTDDWRRAQDNGRPMSRASRDMLLCLWQSSNNDKTLRATALSSWSATTYPDDLDFLRSVASSDDLFDKALAQRLVRGDQLAIPEMIKRFDGKPANYWWQFGRHLWSHDLTGALDTHLTRRASWPESRWGDSLDADWIMSELIIRLPPVEAERLLLKHWSHLRFSPRFVQAALYTATQPLQEMVAAAVNGSPEPTRMFEHLSMHWGYRTTGHPGVTKKDQLLALAPYFPLLPSMEIGELWHVCNEKGWFDLRREILDKYMSTTGTRGWWAPDKVLAVFDEMLKEKHSLWIEHRIDDFLKAGVAWGDIFASMAAWLEQRRSLGALQVVASALAYKGTRADLAVLKRDEDLGNAAMEIVADTTFAVCRRSLR